MRIDIVISKAWAPAAKALGIVTPSGGAGIGIADSYCQPAFVSALRSLIAKTQVSDASARYQIGTGTFGFPCSVLTNLSSAISLAADTFRIRSIWRCAFAASARAGMPLRPSRATYTTLACCTFRPRYSHSKAEWRRMSVHQKLLPLFGGNGRGFSFLADARGVAPSNKNTSASR
jgi:hypothetical protein